MEVLSGKLKWILRVLVDYIVWKKVHVGHTTLDPVKTRRCLNRFASFKNFTADNTFLYRGVKVRNFRYNFSKMEQVSIILPIE